MAYMTTNVQWHDLRIDPDDLPENEEQILVTVELLGGERATWLDVYLKDVGDGKYLWVTKYINEHEELEETVVWYPVIAWAYPPSPIDYF